jgi:hypothetical protein
MPASAPRGLSWSGCFFLGTASRASISFRLSSAGRECGGAAAYLWGLPDGRRSPGVHAACSCLPGNRSRFRRDLAAPRPWSLVDARGAGASVHGCRPWQGATLALILIGRRGPTSCACLRSAALRRTSARPESRGEASSGPTASAGLAAWWCGGSPRQYGVCRRRIVPTYALGHLDPSLWSSAGHVPMPAGAPVGVGSGPGGPMVLTVRTVGRAWPSSRTRPKVLPGGRTVAPRPSPTASTPSEQAIANPSDPVGAGGRQPLDPSRQGIAVRVWPLAALVVYLAPVGTFPYTRSRGSRLR